MYDEYLPKGPAESFRVREAGEREWRKVLTEGPREKAQFLSALREINDRIIGLSKPLPPLKEERLAVSHSAGSEQQFTMRDDMRMASADSLQNIKNLRERMASSMNVPMQDRARPIEETMSSGGYKSAHMNIQNHNASVPLKQQTAHQRGTGSEQGVQRPAVAHAAKQEEDRRTVFGGHRAVAPSVPLHTTSAGSGADYSSSDVNEEESECGDDDSDAEQSNGDDIYDNEEAETSLPDETLGEIQTHCSESQTSSLVPQPGSTSTSIATEASALRAVTHKDAQVSKSTPAVITPAVRLPAPRQELAAQSDVFAASPDVLQMETPAAVPGATSAAAPAATATATATVDISAQLARLQAWEQQLREREEEVLQYKNSLSRPLGARLPPRVPEEPADSFSFQSQQVPSDQNQRNFRSGGAAEIHIHNHLSPVAPSVAQSEYKAVDPPVAQRRWDELPYWQQSQPSRNPADYSYTRPQNSTANVPAPALPVTMKEPTPSAERFAQYDGSALPRNINYAPPATLDSQLSARLTDTYPPMGSVPVMPPATQAVLRPGSGDRVPGRLSQGYAVRRGREVDTLTDSIDLSGLSLERMRELTGQY